jgi:hypothetical protein
MNASNVADSMESKTSSVQVNPALFKVHEALINDLWQVWVKHRDLTKEQHGQEVFSRVSIATLSLMAAVTAVDVSMDEEHFLATCKANYEAAVAKAPRWS